VISDKKKVKCPQKSRRQTKASIRGRLKYTPYVHLKYDYDAVDQAKRKRRLLEGKREGASQVNKVTPSGSCFSMWLPRDRIRQNHNH